jgi:hypothetical protein
MKSGWQLIADERCEHFDKHGRSIERDVIENPNKELAMAACALINPDGDGRKEDMFRLGAMPEHWDYDIIMHMIEKPYLERLIIAGSFIAAEIDRIQHTVYPNA